MVNIFVFPRKMTLSYGYSLESALFYPGIYTIHILQYINLLINH